VAVRAGPGRSGSGRLRTGKGETTTGKRGMNRGRTGCSPAIWTCLVRLSRICRRSLSFWFISKSFLLLDPPRSPPPRKILNVVLFWTPTTCWLLLGLPVALPARSALGPCPEGSVNGPTEGCVRFPLTSPLTVR
jgi:hypothetical protein